MVWEVAFGEGGDEWKMKGFCAQDVLNEVGADGNSQWFA